MVDESMGGGGMRRQQMAHKSCEGVGGVKVFVQTEIGLVSCKSLFTFENNTSDDTIRVSQ